MKYFIPFYIRFHNDVEFHKKIAKVSYEVIKVLEPDALDDFIHCSSGLGSKVNLINSMSIVYGLLEKEIKEFYGYDICLEFF